MYKVYLLCHEKLHKPQVAGETHSQKFYGSDYEAPNGDVLGIAGNKFI